MKKYNKILASRIQIPKPFTNMVNRPSLIEHMDKQAKKIVLLNAGAGFGKTLLLSQYANQPEHHCAWYSISELDNDLVQFIQYLTKSLQNVLVNFDFQMDDYLGENTDSFHVAQIGYDFSMALEEIVDFPLTIILDDFQKIKNEETYEFLLSLIEQTNSRIVFFFAVKGSFPKFLARYLLSGKITLLTAEQMAFGLEEIKKLLMDTQNIRDLDAVVEKVFEVTEGWPAGVMFTLLAIRNARQSITTENIVGICMQSTVNDYIMYEIYRKLPYEVQVFLVHTSVLTILSSDVCNIVMGIDNSKGILDYLVQENLFTVKLSGNGNMYQYHSIFRFFLQTQIKNEEKTRILAKTALYCLQSGDPEQAAEYGVQAKTSEIVERAVGLIGNEFMNQGQFSKMNRWFSYLLESERTLNENTLILLARYYYLQKDYPAALEYIEQAISTSEKMQKESTLITAVLEKVVILRKMIKYDEAEEILSIASCRELKNKNLLILLEFAKLENQLLLQKKTEAGKTLDYINSMELDKRADKAVTDKKNAAAIFAELQLHMQEKEMEEETFLIKVEAIGETSAILRDYLLWKYLYLLYRRKNREQVEIIMRRFSGRQKTDNVFLIFTKILIILNNTGDMEEERNKLLSCFEYIRERNLTVPKWNLEDEKKIAEFLCSEKQVLKQTGSRFLHVYSLGGFTVKNGAGEVKWRTKKARELFAFLFEQGGKICSKDVIIEALWPELPLGTSSTIFHTTLSYIRKGLSQFSMQDLVITKNRGYGLDMSRIKSDVRIFANLCEHIKKKNFQVLEGKENLLNIYRGRYMEGMEFEWSELTAEHMERLFLEACEKIASHKIELQDYNNAIHCLEEALEIDPYEENFYSMLLKCYGELGSIGHVKQQYDKAKRIMREELNVNISEQVTSVYQNYIKQYRG